jgi:uncharacterized protein (TIGR03086 family)
MARSSDDAGGREAHDDEVADTDRQASTAAEVTKLIELGRDREAAELATRGGTMDPRDQLAEVGPLLGGVVGGITPDQLDNQTPCADFTVRGVLEHMIVGATMFTAAFNGTEPGQPPTDDALAGFGPALTGLADAINAPGALEKTIDAPFGAMSGEAFARYVALDGMVHAWDMATATGQSIDPSPALVAELDDYAHQILDGLRDGDTFKAAVEPPADATPIERLAAYTGRNVR